MSTGPPPMTAGTSRAEPVPVTAAGALLGESPLWDDSAGRLHWVDLWAGLVHTTDPGTHTTTTTEVAPPLSAVALTTKGTLAVTQALCVLELTETGTRHLADVPENPCMRVNDAGVDPAGRLWLGTMALPGRPGRAGALWRLDPGQDSPVRVMDDVLLANGIAWSPTADTMYFVDSRRQRITAFAFQNSDGSIGPGEPFVQIATEDGMPDGIAVDDAGAVWVALAGGGAVHRYSSTGELLQRVALPVKYPTSCAFGGPGLRELFVTSGCRPADPAQRATEAAHGAGSVFRVTTDSRGLPTNRMVI